MEECTCTSTPDPLFHIKHESVRELLTDVGLYQSLSSNLLLFLNMSLVFFSYVKTTLDIAH